MGWVPVPLHPQTKVPSRREWQRRTALSPVELRRNVEQELRWRGKADRRDAAVGIVVPPSVLVIDCDLLVGHGTVWRVMVDTLGEPAMVRVGRSPRFMVFYGAGPGIHSRKLPGLEIFCGTGQFAAFGVHHKTDRPYAWSQANPLNTRPEDLQPRVSPQQLEQFVARVVAAGVYPAAASPRRSTIKQAGSNTGSRVSGASVPYDATLRLRELLSKHGGLIKPAVRQLVQEIGKEGCGRHNAIVALVGYLVRHHWTEQDVSGFFTPLVNENFGDGDWSKEVLDAFRHARGCEQGRVDALRAALGPKPSTHANSGVRL